MSDTGPSRSARLAWGAVVVIILAVVGLVTYALTHVSSPTTAVEPAVTAPGVLEAVSTVPAATFDSVGTTVPGADLTPPQVVTGQPLLDPSGKPEVLFIGAEYCPFCAAERWPLVVALSRFGHFTVLRDATSAVQSVFPGTATFSFDGAEYSSPYLSFTGLELYSDQIGADGTFTRIARLSPAQAALAVRYSGSDGGSGGMSPFVDIAGRMVTTTSGFSPALLAGQSQAQIASELDRPPAPVDPATGTAPSPPTGQAIIAAANELTVGICAATGQQPTSVCRSKGVRAAAQSLGATAPAASPG
jgi:hypothetical protein